MNRHNGGFSLIELLIVVVIAGILARIAIPSYQYYVQRAQLVSVTGDLTNARVTFEQYYLDNSTYNGATCPTATNANLFTLACATPQDTGSSPATYSTYTITATGKSGTLMSGFVYTIDQLNAQTSQSPWFSGTVNCWIFRKGDTC